MKLVPALSLGIVAMTLLLVSSIWATARREGRGIGREGEEIADDEIRSEVVDRVRFVFRFNCDFIDMRYCRNRLYVAITKY